MVSRKEFESMYFDKKISAQEFLKIVEDVYHDYLKMFELDKMSFTDFAILENVLIKIQNKVKEELLDE